MTFCRLNLSREKGWAGCAASVFQLMETSRGGKPPIGGRPQPCLQTPLQPGVTGQCQPIGVGLVLATVQAASRVQLIQVVNLMINWFKHFYW